MKPFNGCSEVFSGRNTFYHLCKIMHSWKYLVQPTTSLVGFWKGVNKTNIARFLCVDSAKYKNETMC